MNDMWLSLRRYWFSWQKPAATIALREFHERMLTATQQHTHTEFLDSISQEKASVYVTALDRWLVRSNLLATSEDYYWRAALLGHFFPNPRLQKNDLKRAASLDPGNVDIHVSLGYLATGQQQWDEAIACFDAGIAVAPENFFPWYGRATVSLKLRQFEAALQAVNIAIELRPHLAYGYELRGRIYHETGDLLQAVADLEFAMQCNAATAQTRQLRDTLRKKLQQRNFPGRW